MTFGLGLHDGSGGDLTGSEGLPSTPPLRGLAARRRMPPLSLVPPALEVITTGLETTKSEAQPIRAGLLTPNSQSKLEGVTSRFFRPREAEYSELLIGEIAPAAGSFPSLGGVSAEEIALTHSVASHIFSEANLDTLRDNQELSVQGTPHKFTVIQTDPKTFSLVSPFILGRGQFKNVYYSISHSASSSSEQAFAFSADQKMKLYARTSPLGEDADASQIGADQVIARMLQFTGSEHVAAPHFVVANQNHNKYGGVLFPLLNGGSYQNNFIRLMTSEIVNDARETSRQAIGLMSDVANGLAEIHAAGLFHGDVKPENLMVNRERAAEGTTRLTGYVADLDGLAPSDRPSLFMRTEKYLSPEAMGNVSPEYQWSKDDVWSLGMSYFEMLTQKDFYQSLGNRASAHTSSFRAGYDEGPQFRSEIDVCLRDHLPRDLVHRDELTHLILDMLSLKGTERPLMSEVCDRLARLRLSF